MATIHATWTNMFKFVHSMHQDTVNKTQHQVCSYCLGALNGSPLSVGGWNRIDLNLRERTKTNLFLQNARENHNRKCEGSLRLKMQMFGFLNRGSKLDLKEICDGLCWRPSLFGRSRLPKARECDLKVGFVRRNFSDSEIFHWTLGFGKGRPPPVCLSQPDRMRKLWSTPVK